MTAAGVTAVHEPCHQPGAERFRFISLLGGPAHRENLFRDDSQPTWGSCYLFAVLNGELVRTQLGSCPPFFHVE